MAKRLVIYGGGDIARVASVYFRKDSPYEVAAFTVPGKDVRLASMLGIPIVPFEEIEDRYPASDYTMFVATGFARVNAERAEIYETCKSKGYELATYVSSKAIHFDEFEIGDNCLVAEGNVIQPFAKIGNNVILWSGNFIGHNSQIGDHCFVTSHAVLSGGVQLGPYCFVGVNACFRDYVRIAPKCVIGAGTVILRNTKPGGVYAVRSSPPLPLDSEDLRMK
ncbi:MAG: acetyltransferase [Candidatus Hydrogenedentes bacterium]|nr:acetyltransferase [Candidatus Hydrogenedentota bacterium]